MGRVMNLGDYLKSCREASKRTQHDIAGEVGIEQPYLSKLESGKSIPSNEVFNKLVKVYGIKVEDLVTQLDDTELQRMGELKAITDIMSQTLSHRSDSAKKFSLLGFALLTVGIGMLCFAILPIYSATQYSYRSEGVLTPQEDLNTFDLVYQDVNELSNDAALLAKRTELLARLDQVDVVSDVFKGDGYVVSTADGRRYFKTIATHQSVRDFWNRWLLVPSFMLIVAAISSLLIARRWPQLDK